jgi:hypothetical protein
MMIIVSEAIGSAHWASYLINDDSSGLDERDIALCDAWQESLSPAYVVCIKDCEETGEPEEPWFTWSYDLYTGDPDVSGGSCLTYILHEVR